MINKKLSLLVKKIPSEAIMHDWWIAIVTLKYDGVISYINKTTVLYRQHESNSVGFKNITLMWYLKEIFHIKDIIFSFKSIYIQYKKLNIEINILYFIYLKFIFMINKSIGIQQN